MIFANTLFPKRTTLLIVEAEFNGNVLEILFYIEPTVWPTMVMLTETKFKVQDLRWLEKAILILIFANTVNSHLLA